MTAGFGRCWNGVRFRDRGFLSTSRSDQDVARYAGSTTGPVPGKLAQREPRLPLAVAVPAYPAGYTPHKPPTGTTVFIRAGESPPVNRMNVLSVVVVAITYFRERNARAPSRGLQYSRVLALFVDFQIPDFSIEHGFDGFRQ